MSVLESKTILVGISGGIAAYKACDLVRRLKENGSSVHVVMTKAACEFITPMSLQALSQHPVHTDLFSLEQESKIGHIRLADLPDLIVVSPASADLLAKIAHGLCDDLLTTLIAASPKPKLLCPAMNVHMWENPANQENLKTLERRGFLILPPASGSLACGYEGPGRLPETSVILEKIRDLLTPKTLENRKVLVTAGPTWEPVDAVRHLANPSSGKTGFLIAEEAKRRGAKVTLVTGPTFLEDLTGIETIRVKTAQEMASVVLNRSETSDIVIATAAVSDFRPKSPSDQKLKKTEAPLSIALERNEDILHSIGKKKKQGQILIGFAAETQDLESEAKRKCSEKNLDFVIANDVSKPGFGFGSDQNKVTIVKKNGEIEVRTPESKASLSAHVLDLIETL